MSEHHLHLHPEHPHPAPGHLQRSVGFYGLMFVSLGSIIGSGWLLGALNAAETAGPASIISWILAAAMLDACSRWSTPSSARPTRSPAARAASRTTRTARSPASPRAGRPGCRRCSSRRSRSWPRSPTSTASHAVNENFAMLHATGAKAGLLNGRGLVVAVAPDDPVHRDQPGRRQVHVREQRDRRASGRPPCRCSPSSSSRPCRFHAGNFTAGGGFMPFGLHGVFAALPAGVVFALQGFEQAVQLAGEARNPKKDLSRAILIAMAIGALLYTLLQVVVHRRRRPGATSPRTGARRWARTRPTTAPGTPWPSRSARPGWPSS